MCILSVYIAKSCYYDLSVLSMSVIGFPKKKIGWGWVGGAGELYPILFFEFF